jgi:hypothetical protein
MHLHLTNHGVSNIFWPYRNVWQDIEVPETLLKKRKQNEKTREERLEKAAAAKKVRVTLSPPLWCTSILEWLVKLWFYVLPPNNHLSGLSQP